MEAKTPPRSDRAYSLRINLLTEEKIGRESFYLRAAHDTAGFTSTSRSMEDDPLG